MTDPARPRPEDGTDEAELRWLSTDYAAAVDRCDGIMLAALFVSDGVLMVPDYPDDLRPVIARRGHDALRRLPDGLRRYQRTFHQVSNHRYVVAGDLASGQVACVAHHVTGAEGAEGVVGDGPAGTDSVWLIRYRDDYERTAAGWRIARRELHLQWVEEHPVTVLGSTPTDREVG
jgi:ketosteroid isomerase-like protein